MFKRNGQTIAEHAVLVIIVMVVLIVMSSYVKRAFQGRWKSAVDDLGQQYDPQHVNGYSLQSLTSSSNSQIYTVPDTGGYWTNRVDSSYSKESKTGYLTVQTATPCTSGNCR